MLKGLRATAHVFNQKIGLSRLGLALRFRAHGDRRLGALSHPARDGSRRARSTQSKRPTGARSITAGLFVAAAYLTLSFYDLFALRTIGRSEVPYRVAVLGSFTSYAVGHNVGASVFSGGAVRYRIYSAWGLTRRRGHQDLFRRRADILAGQRRRARPRHSQCPAAGERHRPAADWTQPRSRVVILAVLAGLHRLGVGEAAGDRPRRLAGGAAGRAADAGAGPDRHSGSRVLRGRHVHGWCRTSPISASSRSRSFSSPRRFWVLPVTHRAVSACSMRP